MDIVEDVLYVRISTNVVLQDIGKIQGIVRPMATSVDFLIT